nr:hypothetical protein [Tanacetum cinerariifolium]
MVNFNINLHHDGCFVTNPLHYLEGDHRVVEDIDFEGLKHLKTDEDLKEFVKAGYVKDFKMDIYTEYNGYNVMEMVHNDNLIGEVDDQHFFVNESQDSLGDVKEVADFQTEDDSNVEILKISTDDPWLNKLVGKGKFIGHMDDPILNLNGRFMIEIDDLEQEILDSQYKAKKKFSTLLLTLKPPGINVLCGRDVSEGRCADDLELDDGKGLTIISDAHKGLIKAVSTWFPDVEHRQCTRHIYAHVKRKWSGLQWKRLFWILNARGKPLITMLEDIRIYLMQRVYYMNKQAMMLEDIITPSIRRKLENLKIAQRKWEMSEIPRVHAVVGYLHKKMDPELGVSQSYSKNKWIDAYQYGIRPVLGSKTWMPTSFPKPLPLLERKMLGRPRKNRIRHSTENDNEISKVGRIMHCHKCYKAGHNKKSCKNPAKQKPPNFYQPTPTPEQASNTNETPEHFAEQMPVYTIDPVLPKQKAPPSGGSTSQSGTKRGALASVSKD